MINEFLKISNQHYFGNTALQYAWFIGIIILGFLFLRFFSIILKNFFKCTFLPLDTLKISNFLFEEPFV